MQQAPPRRWGIICWHSCGRRGLPPQRPIFTALRTPARHQELFTAVDQADLLILAFPLYVDSLPYLVINALELIAAHRQTQRPPAPTSFVVIANCGFPEAHQNEPALAMCQEFARQAGFVWAGGLALGQGGSLAGRAAG